MKGATLKITTSIVYLLTLWMLYVSALTIFVQTIVKYGAWGIGEVIAVVHSALIESLELFNISHTISLNFIDQLQYSIHQFSNRVQYFPLSEVLLYAFISATVLFILSYMYMSVSPVRRSLKGLSGSCEVHFNQQLTDYVDAMTNSSRPIKVYVLYSRVINAYAISGSGNKGYIVVTAGLLEILNEEELRFVLGHEIGHVESGDSRANLVVMSGLSSFIHLMNIIAAGHRSMTKLFNIFIMFRILTIIPYKMVTVFLIVINKATKISIQAFRLLDAGFSRRMEYQADARGVEYSNKDAAISVLQKLGDKSFSLIPNVLATHPKARKRIKNLA